MACSQSHQTRATPADRKERKAIYALPIGRQGVAGRNELGDIAFRKEVQTKAIRTLHNHRSCFESRIQTSAPLSLEDT